MSKQTHGGDDDTAGETEKGAKPKLERFGLRPDKNIRDLFWKIIEAKAGKKEISDDILTQAREHRFILINIAASLLRGKNVKTYWASQSSICRRLAEFFIDIGAEDALLALLGEIADDARAADTMAKAIKQMIKKPEYRDRITAFFKAALRKPAGYPIALAYLSKIKDRGMVASMKQELSIFARGDTIENQLNAIAALSAAEDEESAKIIASLLSNWDVEVRRAAAESLKGMKLTSDIIETIKEKAGSETDEGTKKTLGRIVIKWKR